MDRIKIRERFAAGVLLPVVRITFEEDVGAGFALSNDEGTEARGVAVRGFRGEDGNAVEELLEIGDRSWKLQCNGVGVLDFASYVSGGRTKRIGEGRMQIGIHEFAHGEGNVFGGERSAVGEEDAFA